MVAYLGISRLLVKLMVAVLQAMRVYHVLIGVLPVVVDLDAIWVPAWVVSECLQEIV